MTDIPISFEVPPPKRTELEDRAFGIAERAANYAHSQTNGRTASWDDMGPHGQAALMMQALTYLSIQAAVEDRSIGAH